MPKSIGQRAFARGGARARRRLSFSIATIIAPTIVAAADASAQDEKAAPPTTSATEQAPLVPPTLVSFVGATYPTAAEAAGLEAEVILILDVDAAGSVTNASVQSPAGHGFDEAAVDAAKRFVFKPATKAGKPIAARILYKYVFTLKAPLPSTNVAAAPDAGRLQGTVRVGNDALVNGAKVTVRSADGKTFTTTTTTTAPDGTWMIDALPPGSYKVSVDADGYSSFHADEDVLSGESTDVVYRMSVKSDGTTAEVVVRGEPPPREVTRRELSRRELSRIPGTDGDALRAIQSLPGVARSPGLSGLLIVRGSAPQDTQIFVDGTPVPIVYHFGGFSSVVPTESIDKLDFYPGNFGAQFGRAMGGVVDVKLREQDTDGKYHAMAQVDLIDARIMARGPVPIVKDWTFFVAARRSHIDAWIGPVLEATGAVGVTSAPVYYDFQMFAETKPTPTSRFRIGYFGSDDKLELFLKQPGAAGDPAIAGDTGFHTGFGRVQALYENQISESVRVRANVAYGYDATNINAGPLKINIDTNPLTSRGEVSWKIAKPITLNIGEDINDTEAHVHIRAPMPPRPGEANPGPINTRGLLVQNTTQNNILPAAYAELELQPIDRLRIVGGGRMDYSSNTEKWDPSIRTSARYALVNEYPKSTIKAGWGTFYQPPQPQETDKVFGSQGLRSNRSSSTSVGFEQEITHQIDFSAEGYYKDLSSLVARLPTDRGNEYFNTGSGYVAGGEFLLRYKPDERFFGWIAYTISKSMRREQDSDGLTSFQYDQPHILTALASYKLGKGWEVGARFRFVSGGLYTPCEGIGGAYDSAAGAYSCISGQAFSKRLPAFHQLDIRIDKEWDFKEWKLSAYLDLYNVYSHQSADDISYNFNSSQTTYQNGLPIIPSLGLRGEF